MKNDTVLLWAENAIPRIEGFCFDAPINFMVRSGQHWAVIGANGAGKTVFTDMLTGKYALREGTISCYDVSGEPASVTETVKSVAFRDIYGLADIQNSYYQQRWNQGDALEAPLVSGILKNEDQPYLELLSELFDIERLLPKNINLLSSGELRKILIIKSLLSRPGILIVDNPYIGLDAWSRAVFNRLLERLSEWRKVQIILVLSNPEDIPQVVTHVLPVGRGHIYEPYARENFLEQKDFIQSLFHIDIPVRKNLFPDTQPGAFRYAVQMRNVGIRYENNTILKGVSWDVLRGRKWALLGPNGSGKSTLLSLVLGDTPQAYANDIALFDRKRGSGESIWDIKKRIGYVSPEMHLFYLKNNSVKEIVCSGFFDSIGLYRKADEEQEKIALEWMKEFGIDRLADKPFLKISFGEQRLALLARAFVKNPDLLVLDEPLHGLDIANKQRAKEIIENFCGKDKTLIYVTHYEEEIPVCVTEFFRL